MNRRVRALNQGYSDFDDCGGSCENTTILPESLFRAAVQQSQPDDIEHSWAPNQVLMRAKLQRYLSMAL